MAGIGVAWAGICHTGGCQGDCQGTACFGANGLMCSGGGRSTGAPGCERIHRKMQKMQKTAEEEGGGTAVIKGEKGPR